MACGEMDKAEFTQFLQDSLGASARSSTVRSVHFVRVEWRPEFETGFAVGAIVTDKLEEVPELIRRIFENEIEYYLEKSQGDPFAGEADKFSRKTADERSSSE